jgi:type I restriction enzyme R subunit
MTGSVSDPETCQSHIRNKERCKDIEKRFRDAGDPLKLVIMRDMWPTGLDVLSLYTMYLDKLVRKHNLIRAISRINRNFRDKPSGLLVDYLGIAESLREALAAYTTSGCKGTVVLD